MKKCHELASVLATEYAEHSKHKRYPQLLTAVVEKKGEGYKSSYAGGKLKITANNSLAEAYAISQMGTAIRAKHFGDYLGENSPRFTLRPLWLKATVEIPLTEELTLNLPEFMLAEDAKLLLPRFCKRLIECGYNAILIGSQNCNWKLTSNPQPTALDLNVVIQQLHDHGIQVILKPNFKTEISHNAPHKSKEYLKGVLDELFQKFSTIDALFWESLWRTEAYLDGESSLDSTDAEIAFSEIQILENCLQNRSKLVFYMCDPEATLKEAERHAKWMINLLDAMNQGTLLAFNAVNGHIYDDYSNDHPLWELLRQSIDSSATPLLPIINVGLVKQGEGLWPVTNFDLLERFLPRCTRHHFAGVIGTASHLPRSGSVLDCNLWVSGQALWHSIPPLLLAETWFKAFRPEENFAFSLQMMHMARSIVLDLTLLSKESVAAEDAKMHGDSLMAHLRQLKWRIEKETSQVSSHPSIKDHFLFFFKNVQHLIGAFLPTYNLPLSYQTDGDDPLGSFWNHELDVPHRGPKNSLMEAIYMENRYL